MSLPYKPPRLPTEYNPLAIEQVFREMLKAMADGFAYVRYQPLAAEPERMVPDMEVMADGTNWNPGSGAGKYRRDSANTAWVFIG